MGTLAGVHAFSVGGGKECIWDRWASCVGSIKYCMRQSTKSLSREEPNALCVCVCVCACICVCVGASVCNALIKFDEPAMLRGPKIPVQLLFEFDAFFHIFLLLKVRI